MNSNIQQVNEDYKFKIAHVISIFRDMFATEKENNEKELNDRIREIEKDEDTKHIEQLEKQIVTFEVKRQSKITKTRLNVKNVKTKVQDSKSSDIELEEELSK